MTTRLIEIEHPESLPLSEQLRLRLAWLPYLEFALCIARILRHLGYSDIPIPSRLSFKGPNADGGVDLRAHRVTETGSVYVLVQLKRYKDDNRAVPRSAVDELRGKMLRDGIPEGLGFTTIRYSGEAKSAANGYPGRPVRLFEGSDLGALAIAARVGVLERHNPITNSAELIFDEHWFEQIKVEADKIRSAVKAKRGNRGK